MQKRFFRSPEEIIETLRARKKKKFLAANCPISTHLEVWESTNGDEPVRLVLELSLDGLAVVDPLPAGHGVAVGQAGQVPLLVTPQVLLVHRRVLKVRLICNNENKW